MWRDKNKIQCFEGFKNVGETNKRFKNGNHLKDY